MKLHTEEILSKAITAAMFALVLLGTALVFYFLALRVGNIARENQAYDRYNACVLSVPADDRDTAKINRCWTEAQKDTGVEVKRYDK